ncbi:MAG: hypothetical protein ABII06_01195 [Pseudomonadota bacterium]
MEKEWTYQGYKVEEGLKPGSKNFQYYFLVSEGGEKKCNYCVWIGKDALTRFDKAGNFETIISAKKEDWGKWVREKIGQGDFRNVVLKVDREGQSEVDLAEMKEKLSL